MATSPSSRQITLTQFDLELLLCQAQLNFVELLFEKFKGSDLANSLLTEQRRLKGIITRSQAFRLKELGATEPLPLHDTRGAA